MKPDVSQFLTVATMHLVTTAPSLARSYDQSGMQIMAMLLVAVNEEADRAAARRVEENQAIRRLFSDAATVVTDTALRNRLVAAAGDSDPDLTVSALERSNAALRQLLIELHAHVEALETAEARRIEAAIWIELVASTERRKLSLGPF